MASPVRSDSPFPLRNFSELEQLQQENRELRALVKDLFSRWEIQSHRINGLKDDLERKAKKLEARIIELEQFVNKPRPKEVHDPLGLLEQSSSKREKIFDPEELSLPSLSSESST